MHPDTVPILLIASAAYDRDDLSFWLREHFENLELTVLTDLSEGLRCKEIPRLVILSAGYSQAWSLQEFAQLWNALPLARWLMVQEGWSDSAIRHFSWLPVGCCVPRERLEIRLRQELDVLSDHATPLPLTASLEETFERDAELPDDISLQGMNIALYTPDRDLRGYWKDFITAYGGQIVSLEQQPHAVLWDCDPWQKDRIRQLAIYRRRDPGCRILGFRNIVHELAETAAQDAGADLMLPKNLSAALVLNALSVSRV